MNDWMERGACKGSAANFFPERGEDCRPAKKVCATCPVQAACRAYSMRFPHMAGIWGGLSEQQRRQLGRRRKLVDLPECPVCGERVGRSRATYCSRECRSAAS